MPIADDIKQHYPDDSQRYQSAPVFATMQPVSCPRTAPTVGGVDATCIGGHVMCDDNSTSRLSAIKTNGEARWVPGYEGLYAVTDRGEVYSFHRGAPSKMKPNTSGSGGYPRVSLTGLDGSKETKRTHRVVLTAFEGEAPDGYECRHLNGDRTDNRLENLAWGTRKKNAEDRLRHGTNNSGEVNGRSKLSEHQVREMHEMRDNGATYVEIGEHFGVSDAHAWSTINGVYWKEIYEEMSQ